MLSTNRNTRGNLTSVSNGIGGKTYAQYYYFSDTGVSGSAENGKDGLPTRYIALGTNTYYTYDSLNRLTLKSVKVSDSVNLNNVYSYLTTSRNEAGKSYATTRLGAETVVGVTYGYTYDAVGNITGITRAGGDYKSYTYDALGELKSETQHTLNRKATYFYTPLGNIYAKIVAKTNPTPEEGDGVVSKIAYGYSADSDAGWNNLLTSLTFTDYTNSGTQVRTETIDYDAIGNPLSYRGAAMSWFGRQMRTYSKGTTSASFNYDADGLRSEKTVNGVKTTYQYVGDKLYYENIGDNKILYYFYDSYGNLSQIYYMVGATYARYYVATNAQGDVVAIYDSNGVKVGAYDYDAWGNTRMFVVTQDANGNNIHTQINPETQYLNHIINVNPIRYRGYYYDSDLDLYYLQSRYYDSEIGRFINGDGYVSTGQGVLSHNMFAYCDNNPVVRVDHGGQFWDTVFDVISLGASIVEVCVNPTDPWAWAGLAGDAIDLIPFVTGVGEVTRAVKTIDKVADTVQIAKAVDFTEDAADIVKTLDRSSGFTKSTASAGRKIHQGYKATNNFPKMGKEFRGIKGIRPDYIDFNTRTIYELKPMNPRGVRSGIRQLQRYNKALGGGFNLRLELY